MEPLPEFGIRLIQALQSSSPALDGLMHLFSFLGRIEFYLLLLPLIYWSVDKQLGLRTLLVLITTDVFGAAFKLLFHQPRPYWVGGVKPLAEESSYGIPSTHASNSLAVWGYLAYRLRKTWLWIVIALVVFFIGLSRLYLGVHFPHDVVFGWLIGAIVLGVFVKVERPIAVRVQRLGMWQQIGVGLALSLVVILIGLLIHAWLSGIPEPVEWSAFAVEARAASHWFTLSGSLFGGITGYVLMQRYAKFQSGGRWLQRLGRYALGLVGVLILYFALDVLFGMFAADETVMGYALRYVRYAVVTIWVFFIAPWIFLRIRLAERQTA